MLCAGSAVVDAFDITGPLTTNRKLLQGNSAAGPTHPFVSILFEDATLL